MMLRRLGPLALVALALACSGSERDESDDGAPATPEVTTAANQATTAAAGMCQLPAGGYMGDCNACLEGSCCTEVEACKDDAGCAAQLTCIIECQYDEDPGSCSQACAEPGGVHAGYTAYDDCSFSECRSACWM